MITIACVLVKGHVGFTPMYVERLQSMAKRFAPAHRFVCLTDQAAELPGVQCIPIEPLPGIFAWWSKLQLFNPRHRELQSGRILYLDLDVLLVDRIVQIAEFDAPFALVPDGAPGFFGKGNKRTVKRYNSSVMVWNGGEQNELYTAWNATAAEVLWGDQDWIGERAPHAATMPREWFPRLSAVRPPWPEDTKVVLCKRPKNHMAAEVWPWFERAWH